jgi:hypothetical protein
VTCGGGLDVAGPENRKVGGSTPPLATPLTGSAAGGVHLSLPCRSWAVVRCAPFETSGGRCLVHAWCTDLLLANNTNGGRRGVGPRSRRLATIVHR